MNLPLQRTVLAGIVSALCALAAPYAQACSGPGCAGHKAGHAHSDRHFEAHKREFLKQLFALDPDLAMAAGRFEGAATLPLPDPATRARTVAFARTWQARLEQVPAESLSGPEQADLALMKNYLNSTIWYVQTFREFEWNPAQHNIAGAFDTILNTAFAPKTRRVQLAIRRLQAVPAFYAAAQASIERPTAEHTRLAIAQSAGAATVLDELEHAAATVKLNAHEQRDLQQGLQQARTALQGYVAWLKQLEQNLTPENSRPFRIGKALYEGKFAADIQSSFSAAQAYRRALAAMDAAHDNMEELADQLWTQTMGEQAKPDDRIRKIALVIAKLSENHVAAKDLFPEIRGQLPVLEKWIREHDLLELDTHKPLVVRETPLYQRGVTVASIEAPGIFRPGDKTYYNVTPLDGRPPEQIESTLREYNHWVLQILNIHEAIPGHYTQLQHANRSPSVIKTLFGNGAMIEGWAVYSERMMLESGYGGNTPEMWLMYYKWNLRAICNTILDYSVHVLGMSEADAMDFLMHQAFQTEAEARGKWQRVQYTSVQLTSYFSGYSEIMELREQWKKQQHEHFNLRQFNEQFLSYGSAPVGMIRGLMLGEHGVQHSVE